MSVQLDSKRKREIFKEFGNSETNTGSIEGQVAILTEEIKILTNHLNINKKDQVSRRALLTKVGKRKRFLKYLMGKDILKYRALIDKLGIRK
ncbi:MAG: 30S ribosomal protein S15 [Deltaproteobacteria bacterium]